MKWSDDSGGRQIAAGPEHDCRGRRVWMAIKMWSACSMTSRYVLWTTTLTTVTAARGAGQARLLALSSPLRTAAVVTMQPDTRDDDAATGYHAVRAAVYRLPDANSPAAKRVGASGGEDHTYLVARDVVAADATLHAQRSYIVVVETYEDRERLGPLDGTCVVSTYGGATCAIAPLTPKQGDLAQATCALAFTRFAKDARESNYGGGQRASVTLRTSHAAARADTMLRTNASEGRRYQGESHVRARGEHRRVPPRHARRRRTSVALTGRPSRQGDVGAPARRRCSSSASHRTRSRSATTIAARTGFAGTSMLNRLKLGPRRIARPKIGVDAPRDERRVGPEFRIRRRLGESWRNSWRGLRRHRRRGGRCVHRGQQVEPVIMDQLSEPRLELVELEEGDPARVLRFVLRGALADHRVGADRP